jgi:hypothetical protein
MNDYTFKEEIMTNQATKEFLSSLTEDPRS